MRKIKVAIIFGGKSAEHEVSLQSAKNVFEAIDKNKYEPILIGINKQGKWILGDSISFLLNANSPHSISLNSNNQEVAILPTQNGVIKNLDFSKNKLEQKIDVAFPILHGPFGEDGTMQGLLKLADIPFVGSSVLGSAVGMDKDVMKRLLKEAGLPVAKFLTLKQSQIIPSWDFIKQKLGDVVFIKPANMGSSVGVCKVLNEDEYKKAISEAFLYDTKILIEEFIKGREIECAVLGNEDVIASVCGEVIPTYDFYSYEAKYLDENGAKLQIPANIPNEVQIKIQKLAIDVFKTLSCEGLGRVDFFLKENNDIIINEINTMPGFTKISMYPKLFEASGILYSQLIDKLITLAIERFEKEKKLKTTR